VPDHSPGIPVAAHGGPPSRLRPLLIAGLAALAAAALANGVEWTFNNVARPDRRALEWISDVVLSAALALAAYLWLHLRDTRSELARLERVRIVLETELALASQIQRNLLAPVPTDLPGLTLAARLEPAEKVGGDFYDFLRPEEGTLVFILGDVSGKGIPAALVMTAVRAFFRTLARKSPAPAALAEQLSNALHQDTGGAPYATGILGRLDLRSRTLTYVNAGHPPGVVVGAAGCRVAASTGPPLGLLPGARFTEESIVLLAGDLGAFVTDGVTDALDTSRWGGVPAFLEAVLRGAPSPPRPEAICDALMQLAREGPRPSGEGDWYDDRTVVAFALDGPA